MLVLKCDVKVGSDVVDALATAASSGAGIPPVRGIVHADCPSQWEVDGEDTALEGRQQRFLETKV